MNIIDQYIEFLSNVMDMDEREVKEITKPRYIKDFAMQDLKFVADKDTINPQKVSRFTKHFKYDQPILINQYNKILDGNHRFLAAKVIGMATINVIKVNIPKGYFPNKYY